MQFRNSSKNIHKGDAENLLRVGLLNQSIMKNITTQGKLFYCLLTILFLSMTEMQAQWDYINFTDDADEYLSFGCIDDTDNVYGYGNDTGWLNVIRKFDPNGSLLWTKDISPHLTYSSSAQTGGGGMQYTSGNVYTVGVLAQDGVVVETGTSAGGSSAVWEHLNGSAANEITDIKIQGNHMYVIGHYGSVNTGSSSLGFDSNAQTITGTFTSSFVAKYTISPKAIVWVNKIQASNIVRAINIDVDSNDNVYVTGDFRGTATFYSNGGTNTYSSNNNTYVDTFLARFDSNGDYDATYGLKTESLGGNKRSYDVEVSNLNNTVYWAEAQYVHALDINGSGANIWTYALPNASRAYSLATNNCGDIYATGQADVPVTRAPCGGDFFGVLIDSSTGTTVWPSNSTSCSSYGGEVMIDSNDKEVFMGSYYNSGGAQPIIIDGSYSSSGSDGAGYFIGRYDDSLDNSCCDDIVDLGSDVTVCLGGSFPVLDITSQISGAPSIEWFLDGNITQTGGTTLNTSGYGIYSVEVSYSQVCVGIGMMEVNNDGCCDYNVDIGPNLTICEGDAWPVLDITGQVPGFTSIIWTRNGGAFQQPVNSETVTTVGAGTYTVVVEYNNGCVTSDSMLLTVENCEPNCMILPKYKKKIKDCTVAFANLTTSGNGTTIQGYLWDFGDGHTSNDVSPIHSYAAPGNYIVTLTAYGIDAHGNCCLVAIQFIVRIDNHCPQECGIKPLINMEYVTQDVALFSSGSFSNAFTHIMGYEWTINGVVVSNSEFFATEFHGGEVCLRVFGMTDNRDCCEERICKTYHSPHNSRDAEETHNFDLYPNPSKGQVILDFSEMNVEGAINFVIYDAYGRVVFRGTSSAGTYEINNSSWATGIYLVRAANGDVISIKKLIKE